MALVSLLLLSVCLAEIHCQTTFPYVSFLGHTLANHSYVDLSLVRDYYDGSDSVQCRTDLRLIVETGTILTDQEFNFQELRIFTRVVNIVFVLDKLPPHFLGYITVVFQPIPTVTVHSDVDISVRESVFVGLYGSGGE